MPISVVISANLKLKTEVFVQKNVSMANELGKFKLSPLVNLAEIVRCPRIYRYETRLCNCNPPRRSQRIRPMSFNPDRID